MIPQQLSLKNFLSYREAVLDFTGLHTACICGPNGAGKSSLLEAIVWVIWGECRTVAEEDVIHIGELEARVDFIFSTQGRIYRIIRHRRRSQALGLEFQVALTVATDQPIASLKFRSLTEKGVRQTQQKIIDYLKLDCDTFLNSAYLRQGKADEFMLKKPQERKDVLANLLKLDQYDLLAERAKEINKQYKNQAEVLQQSIGMMQADLQQADALTNEQATLQIKIDQLKTKQAIDREQLQELQAQQHNRQAWQKLLLGQQQQAGQINQDYRRIQTEITTTRQQQNELQALLQQASEINQNYQNYQNLQSEEETLSLKFKAHQEAWQKRQNLQEQQRQQLRDLENQINQVHGQIDSLKQQEAEVQEILKQQPEVETGLAKLQATRQRLQELDQLHNQIAPLLQRQQLLQMQIDRAKAHLMAQIEALMQRVKQAQLTQQQKLPLIQTELKNVSAKILELDNKKVYQQRVREKGQERDQLLKKLATNKLEHEAKMAELEQKMLLLKQGMSQGENNYQYPPCPLCDRPLDEHHWNLVINKHQTQQEELRDLIWIVRGQLVASEGELKVLQEEYLKLKDDLSHYEELREKRGRLQAQLEAINNDSQQFQQMQQELNKLEHLLHSGDYARDEYRELGQLENQLKQLDYNEQTHALIRNEEKNLRWAEIKLGRIKDAQAKLGKIQAKRPELEAQIVTLQQQLLDQKSHAPLQQQIQAIDLEIKQIDYHLEEHNYIRQQIRDLGHWVLRYQNLQNAEQQYPGVERRLSELLEVLESRSQDLQLVQTQINEIQQQLQNSTDPTPKIRALEDEILQGQRQLDQCHAASGKLQQQEQHLADLQEKLKTQQQQLEVAKHQAKIYHELDHAFGKNGIQTLMIENVLPQLEAESNNILSRLSGNQLHIQFVTQKATKASKSSAKKEAKMIETLEIIIGDARGSRPYETYSGGEAFRINFAIRLALAKLLAQRSGASLQMLIIDEGFGTQDAEGCDRLIAAINAISSDFACILTVTHIPHLKEAFQARIEVSKTPQGSQIRLSI